MDCSGYQKQRHAMVEDQLAGRGIDDRRILDAMGAVPRHEFMPEPVRPLAYADRAVAIGSGQTISQPYIVALMTKLLELTPEDRVLEIGAGSGYQTAVLASIANRVVSLERHGPLAQSARKTLERFGYTNVAVVLGDGTKGYPQDAPYDAILVTAGAPAVPPSLDGQLADGGRLVCPVGSRDAQELVRLRRTPYGIRRETGIRCTFVPLIGAEGWAEPAQ